MSELNTEEIINIVILDRITEVLHLRETDDPDNTRAEVISDLHRIRNMLAHNMGAADVDADAARDVVARTMRLLTELRDLELTSLGAANARQIRSHAAADRVADVLTRHVEGEDRLAQGIPAPPIGRVTRRELDILKALCTPVMTPGAPFVAPATAREIAAALGIPEAVVNQHLLRLYEKFRVSGGLNRRIRLANEVVALGLVQAKDQLTAPGNNESGPLPPAVPELTRRELDVLVSLCRPTLTSDAFVAPATTAREIAADLAVTEAVVNQHLLRLYEKFRVSGGLNRRIRLANEVVALGLVQAKDQPAAVGS